MYLQSVVNLSYNIRIQYIHLFVLFISVKFFLSELPNENLIKASLFKSTVSKVTFFSTKLTRLQSLAILDWFICVLTRRIAYSAKSASGIIFISHLLLSLCFLGFFSSVRVYSIYHIVPNCDKRILYLSRFFLLSEINLCLASLSPNSQKVIYVVGIFFLGYYFIVIIHSKSHGIHKSWKWSKLCTISRNNLAIFVKIPVTQYDQYLFVIII